MSWLLPQVAAAAVRLARAPAGWSETHRDAETPQAWADVLRGTVVEVWGPDVDDADDLIAVLDVPGPMGVVDDPSGYLVAHLAGALGVQSPPTHASALAIYEGAPPIVRGRFTDDDAAYHVAVVSSGTSRGVVIFATSTEDEKLYGSLFENAIVGLEGVGPPQAEFPHRMWWGTAAVGWGLLALVFSILVVRSAEPGGRAGRVLATVCVLLAGVTMVVAFVMLGDAQAELVYSGLTRSWVVAELGLMGLGAAGIVMVVGSISGARTRPVQSAPAGGTFAERPRLRPTIPVSPPIDALWSGTARPPSPPQAAASGAIGATPPPLPYSPEAAAPLDPTAFEPGTLAAPPPVGISDLGLGSRGVSPARTAPIVLRGEATTKPERGRAEAAPAPTASTGAPSRPVRLDRTLVGAGPKSPPAAPKLPSFPPIKTDRDQDS